MKRNNAKWLITGCSGFVGLNIIEFLIKKKQKIIGIDLIKPKLIKNKNFKFIKYDLTKKKNLKKYLYDVDYIINLAAIVSIPYSLKFPKKTINNNVKIFRNILESLDKNKTKCIIFASSSAVYGNKIKKIETSKLKSFQSAYAKSKYINEIDAKKFYKNNQISIVGLRYFNLFGPNSKKKSRYSSVIPTWLDKIKKNNKINIYGNGEQTRDFVFIEDIAKINYLLARELGKRNKFRILNIGTEKQTSINKLIQYILKIFKKKKYDIKYYPLINPGVKTSVANMNRFNKEISFKFTNIKKGLKKTIQLYE